MAGASNVDIAEEDDAANIVFPSGKSAVEGEARRPKSRGSEKNVAKGKYGTKPSSPAKKRKAAAPVEPPRTPLQSGIFKLVEASVRYHPEKDRVLKQGFAGEGLTPPELRDMLRRLFHVKLTEPELSAVFAHFVPGGGMELDGITFIVHFIQVRLRAKLCYYRCMPDATNRDLEFTQCDFLLAFVGISQISASPVPPY